MSEPQKHAALIHAWADGAEIESVNSDGTWVSLVNPVWRDDTEYRVKRDKHQIALDALREITNVLATSFSPGEDAVRIAVRALKVIGDLK